MCTDLHLFDDIQHLLGRPGEERESTPADVHPAAHHGHVQVRRQLFTATHLVPHHSGESLTCSLHCFPKMQYSSRLGLLQAVTYIVKGVKGKGSPYSITERRVPELIPVLGSQPAGDVSLLINPAVGCHYFPPGLQLSPQPLRGLQPVLLLAEQRHNGCEQFA